MERAPLCILEGTTSTKPFFLYNRSTNFNCFGSAWNQPSTSADLGPASSLPSMEAACRSEWDATKPISVLIIHSECKSVSYVAYHAAPEPVPEHPGELYREVPRRYHTTKR